MISDTTIVMWKRTIPCSGFKVPSASVESRIGNYHQSSDTSVSIRHVWHDVDGLHCLNDEGTLGFQHLGFTWIRIYKDVDRN